MKNQKASSHQKPLSLVDMSSAFVLLALIGISLSILIFLLELIFKRIKDHYFTDHKQVDQTPLKPLQFKQGQQKHFTPKSNNLVGKTIKKTQSSPVKIMSDGPAIIPKTTRPSDHNIKQGQAKLVPAAVLVKQVQAKRAVTVIPTTKQIANNSIKPLQIQAEIHAKANNNSPAVKINNQRPVVNIDNARIERKQGRSDAGKTINKNQATAAVDNKRKKISALSFDKIEILE